MRKFGPSPGSRIAAIIVGGVAGILFGGAVIIGLVFDTASQARLGDVFWAFSNLLISLVGAVIVVRRPGNRVGVLLLLGGVAGVGQIFFKEWALLSLTQGELPAESLAAWLGAWLWFPSVVMFPLLLIVFPSGRPLPRWRWLWWLGVGLALAGLLSTFSLWNIPNRILIDPTIPSPDAYFLLDSVVAPLLSLVVLPLALASSVARYRRAKAREKNQIKWLAWAMGTSLSLLVASNLISPLFELLGLVSTLALSLIPLAIANAILRYGLYDIDRIISRTVSYALVIGVLGVVVLGLAALLATFLPSDDPLVVAISTLTAFALFNPLRRRVQKTVDRRFNRTRYNAQRVVRAYTETVQEQTNPEDVVDGWVEVVTDTMQPATMGVWVRE